MMWNKIGTIAVLLICFTAGLYASEIRVGPKEQFKQINQALKEAKPGDTVFIAEGEYEENITLPCGINLRGEDLDKTIIRPGPMGNDRTFVLVTKGPGNSRVENLSFCSKDTQVEGLLLGQCSAQIINCHIEGFSGAGISVHEKAQVEVNNCTVEACQKGISAYGPETELVVTNSTVQQNKERGIMVYGGSRGKVSHSRVVGQGKIGISFNGKGTTVDISGCQIFNNSQAGIHLWKEARGVIRQTACEDNDSGIMVCDSNTQCDIEECRVQFNRQHGIYFYTDAQGSIRKTILRGNNKNGIYLTKIKSCTVEQNFSLRNGANGISAEGQKMDVVVASNTCSENWFSGIYAGLGVNGRIEKNVCKSNACNGIQLELPADNIAATENECSQNTTNGISCLKGSPAVLSRNQCTQNGNFGIYMDSYARPVLEANTCKDNRQNDEYREQGNFDKIRDDFLAGKFESLEALKAQLQKDKAYNDTGGLKLYYFYSELSAYWNGSARTEKAFLDAIDKWSKEKPDSVTPRILLATFYRDIAREARGGSWAKDVPEAAWTVFKDNLQKARQILQKAGDLKDKEPQLYYEMLIIGKGLSFSDDMMEKILKEGVQVDPAYHYLYNERAWSLLPRWSGKRGQVGQFAEQIADKYKDAGGLEFYARMAKSVYDPRCEDFLKNGFVYEKIKQGHLALIKKFKPLHWQNSLCVFACLYGDKETAKEMFEKIGNNIELDTWKNDRAFYEQARAWITGQQKEPPKPTTEQDEGKDVYKNTTTG